MKQPRTATAAAIPVGKGDAPAPRHHLSWWPQALLLAIVLLEALWLIWILREPLPNASNVGGSLSRSVLLWRAFPQVVPGLTWSQSFLGQAAERLSTPRNLVDRLPIVLGAALIAAAALMIGRSLLRILGQLADLRPFEALALSYGLGASTLGVITLLTGRLGALAPWPVRAVLLLIVAAGIGSELVMKRRQSNHVIPENQNPQRKSPPWSWLSQAAIITPFLILMALGALQPTFEYDSLEYHLQGPKQFYQNGQITFLPHNVYTSMPFNIEMLHLLAMHVLGDWRHGALGGQLLTMLFAPATGALVYAACWRLNSARAAWFAAVVYLTTPWVFRLGVIPFVEGPLCFYHAALVATVIRCHGLVGRWRSWLLLGLLAGSAMACKYPALISAVVPFGAVALLAGLRERDARLPVHYALGVALVIGPWLLKNLADTGNPVYPLAFEVFGSRQWDQALDAKWAAAHGPRPVSYESLKTGLLDVAGRSDWQSPLYLALAPLALLRPGSRRAAWWLWAYVFYLFATWYLLTHRLDRFWIPLLPALAMLTGLGADWTRKRAWTLLLALLVMISLLSNAVLVTTDLSGPNRWTEKLATLHQLVTEELNPPLARLDERLSDNAKVLLVGQASVFHLKANLVNNTVFNHEILEELTRGRTPAEVSRSLHDQEITHIYLDWAEVARFRQPGNYGFTDFVTPELLAGLVRAGVLDPPEPLGPSHELYRVR